MRRKLWIGAVVLSLALCALTVALRARSFRTWEDFEVRTNGGNEYSVRGYDGEVEFRFATELERGMGYTAHGRGAKPKPVDWSKIPRDWVGVLSDEDMFWRKDFIWTPNERFGRWGFRAYGANFLNGSYPGRCWSLTVPGWFFTASTLVLPVVGASRWLLKRRRPGLCYGCGYDLTGNTSGVCPECGEKILSRGFDVDCSSDQTRA